MSTKSPTTTVEISGKPVEVADFSARRVFKTKLAQYLAAREKADAAKEQAEALKEGLKAYMDKEGATRAIAAGVRLDYEFVNSTRLDAKRFLTERPKLASRYMVASSSRPFKVTVL